MKCQSFVNDKRDEEVTIDGHLPIFRNRELELRVIVSPTRFEVLYKTWIIYLNSFFKKSGNEHKLAVPYHYKVALQKHWYMNTEFEYKALLFL